MPYVLPATHRFAYDYAVFLHDLIVGLVKIADQHGVFSVDLQLTPDEQAEVLSLEGEALYSWIEDQKGPAVTAEMDYKALIRALSADFCHFVLEGLRAASRGKLTVAYALLRKPFKDNLFYLEWLLADPGEFLASFRDASPEGLDIARLGDKRLAVVTAAADKVDAPGVSASLLHEIRYDRGMPGGFAVSWDQASHLVTTWAKNRTDPQNLNFVFSGAAELATQWSNVFWLAPYVLYHASFVVENLFLTLAKIDQDYLEMKWLRRAVGYELWAEYGRGDVRRSRDFHPSLMALIEALPLDHCPRCRQPLPLHRRNLQAFAVRGTLRCTLCRTTLVVDGTSAPA